MNITKSINYSTEIVFSESKIMYLMRSFAIFSVISAHCATVNDYSDIFQYSCFQMLTAFGILGVPIFFFSSGYFFFNNIRKKYLNFLSHKIKTFFIPWIVSTTLIYLYVALRKDGINIKDYAYFLFGINNYTYFLTILLIFYLALLKSNFRNSLICTCISLSLISLTLTTTGILNSINPYCNPLNWLIYFSIGIVFRKYNRLKYFASKAMNFMPWLFFLFILLNIAFIFFRLKINYWSIGGYLYILVVFFLALGFTYKYKNCLTKLITIGKNSMTIFLIHSPFAGILVYITNQFDLWYLIPFRPFIILLVVTFIIWVYKKFANYFNIENLVYPLIGLSK